STGRLLSPWRSRSPCWPWRSAPPCYPLSAAIPGEGEARQRALQSRMPTLDRLIRELGLAAARARGARYLLHALVAAAAWGALVMAVAHLAPIEWAPAAALAGLPVTLAGAA